MAMEEPVGGIGREIARAIAKELLDLLGELVAGDGVAGRTPPVEERSARNHRQRRLIGIGLAHEVPHVGIAEGVGVGIAGKEIGDDIVGEIPGLSLPRRLADREVDGGQIAGVVASPGADREEDDIPRLHRDLRKRPDRDDAVPLGFAGGKTHHRAPAPHLHHPCDAIATGGVGMLHRAVDRHRGRHRALPSEDGAERRRRMNGEAFGLHRPRHLHRLIRRIGDHREGIGGSPPLHERVIGMRLHPPGDPSVELHSPLADPEVGKPGRENRPVNTLPGSERIELGVIEGAVGSRPFDPGDEAEDLGGGVDEH